VVGLFFSGIGLSATAPQLTLFLVDDLGASLSVAGLYYLTNLMAPVAGYLIGRLSDRSENRLVLYRICALAGAVGWTVNAFAHAIWVPFVVSIVALSIGGAAMSQLFAACRDELNRNPTGADSRVISVVRMAYTAGFILGPVLGAWFGSVAGLRAVLLATAACLVAQIIPLGTQRVVRFRRVTRVSADGVPEVVADAGPAALIVFTGLTIVAMAGDTIKFGYLPIYMDQNLGLPDSLRGAVIGLQPLLEFCLMPIAAWCADRFGPLRVFSVGIALGAIADIAYATSTSVAGVIAGQVLVAGQWGCVAGLGVVIAQDLYPSRVGTASGIFMSSVPIAGALGGAVGGLGAGALGLPHVFLPPAVLSAGAFVGMVLLAQWQRKREAELVGAVDPGSS
jgi:SET family sugar efflux transporter-like MFS transporter